MTCVRALRQTEKEHYLDTRVSTSFTTSSSTTIHDSNNPALATVNSPAHASINYEDSNSNNNNNNNNNNSNSNDNSNNNDSNNNDKNNQNIVPNPLEKHQGNRYISCVTRLMDRLLSIFENMRLVLCSRDGLSYSHFLTLSFSLSFLFKCSNS